MVNNLNSDRIIIANFNPIGRRFNQKLIKTVRKLKDPPLVNALYNLAFLLIPLNGTSVFTD